jgi:CHAT domain-containing protein/Tfp pilus assembly protein PilF
MEPWFTHNRRQTVIWFCLWALVCGLFPASSVPERVFETALRRRGPVSADDRAIEETLFQLMTDIENHTGFPDAYQRLLELYLAQERDADAQAYFNRLTAYPPHRQNSHWMLARIQSIQGDDSAAFCHFKKALSSGGRNFELIADFLEFDCRHSGGYGAISILKSIGYGAEAIQTAYAVLAGLQENYAEAVRLFERNPSKGKFPQSVLDLWGQCLYRASKPAQADSVWRLGLALARQGRCGWYESAFLTDLGVLETSRGNFKRALAYLDSSENVALKMHALHHLHKIFSRRASVYAKMGRYREALLYDEKAIHTAERIHADRDLADWVFNNAQILYSTGRFFEALRAFDRCENLYKRFKIKKQVVEVNYRKACLFLFLNQIEIARNILEQAYQSAKAYRLTTQQKELSTELALLMIPEKKYGEARKLLLDNIRYFESQKDHLYGSYCVAALAEVYQEEGMVDQAIDSFEKAVAYAQRAGSEIQASWCRLSIARLRLLQKREKEAITACRSIIPVAVSERDNNLLLNTYSCLGKAFRLHGDVQSAIRYDQMAVEIVENIRRNLELEPLQIGYFSTVVDASRELASCYLPRYRELRRVSTLDTLLYYVEMSRARSIMESGGPDPSARKDSTYRQQVKTLHILQRQIRMNACSFERQDFMLQELQTIRYSIMGQLLKPIECGLKKHLEKAPVISSRSIQNRLKKNRAGLLVYMITEDASFALAADGNEARIVPLDVHPSWLQKAVDSLITPFHGATKTSLASTAFRAELAHRLYRRLFQPVESVMALPENVTIVPDLPMTNLPFEILLSESPAKKEYTPKERPDYARLFLMHRYCFSYAPSISFLIRNEKPAQRNPGVAVFSNPFDGQMGQMENKNFRLCAGWSMVPLPFSDVEAQEIKRVCRRTRIFRRSSATKSVFFKEASRRQILHFATHAFVDPAFDDFSGLVLAAGSDSTDDGLLMGYEISNLPLKCDLVTLSACETGCGHVVGGEGVLGLPRLFLKSGAQSVLMTLWKVDDRFASMLMPLFYDRFLNQNMSKAKALCEAKRAVLSQAGKNPLASYAHPFFWASFVLYGNPGMRQNDLRDHGPVVAAVWGVAVGMIFFAAWFFYFRPGNGNRCIRRRRKDHENR